MQFTILLVNYNMSGLVLKLLPNIVAQFDDQTRYEVIIADNSSEEAGRLSEEMLPAGVSVRVVSMENRGFVDALNRIFPLAQGTFVVVMHPDVELLDGCLKTLAAFLELNPKAGVVSPDLYYPNGEPNRIRTRFPSIGTEVRRILNKLGSIAFRRKVMRDEYFWDRRSDVRVETVMSVCMMFRGSALARIEGIDPRLEFYYANDYICGRLRRMGWSCHYTLSAKAIHFERYTPKELYKSDVQSMEYKHSTVAANPRMRSDYFTFLSSFYPSHARFWFRLIATFDDGLQLVANMMRWRSGGSDHHKLIQSLRIDLGLQNRP